MALHHSSTRNSHRFAVQSPRRGRPAITLLLILAFSVVFGAAAMHLANLEAAYWENLQDNGVPVQASLTEKTIKRTGGGMPVYWVNGVYKAVRSSGATVEVWWGLDIEKSLYDTLTTGSLLDLVYDPDAVADAHLRTKLDAVNPTQPRVLALAATVIFGAVGLLLGIVGARGTSRPQVRAVRRSVGSAR